jgi:mannitol-1-/sugar-/sorbitol-6-/2-deoxyglucose-6-phosphatase
VEISAELALQTTGLRTAEVVSYWHNYFKWEAKRTEQVAD